MVSAGRAPGEGLKMRKEGRRHCRAGRLPGAPWLGACLCAAALGAGLRAQEADSARLAPYYPTPETIVGQMLRLGGLKAGEKVFDLGSGDGRIVIMAAQKFHADAVGVEIDTDLCRQSLARIAKLGLERSARI